MLGSAASLGAAQVVRALSLPEQLNAPSPQREAALEALRQRNAFLDFLFYDVGAVSPAEAACIAPRWAAEGAILLVPPSGSDQLQLCLSVEDFVKAGGSGVSALVVAGVGSSALGSAAFARNVADAIGRPVAAVVSGYGLADLATEALGGFFWFGYLNQARHVFERLDRATEPKMVDEPATIGASGSTLVRSSRDTRTVLALLEDDRLSFDLLSGHSKGNLVISEALYALMRGSPGRARALAASSTIVTVSARIAMPKTFERVVDVMGGWDWFGGLNSRLDIEAEHVVAQAWHHTNTELPAHLPVTRALRRALG